MREIHLSLGEVMAWVDAGEGQRLTMSVHLDWPELQLSPAELQANADAVEDRETPPHLDRATVLIVVE